MIGAICGLEGSEKCSHHNGGRRKCKFEVVENCSVIGGQVSTKKQERDFETDLSTVILECQRNSICPRRRIREREQSERGPFA